jgi:hypothetical protein
VALLLRKNRCPFVNHFLEDRGTKYALSAITGAPITTSSKWRDVSATVFGFVGGGGSPGATQADMSCAGSRDTGTATPPSVGIRRRGGTSAVARPCARCSDAVRGKPSVDLDLCCHDVEDEDGGVIENEDWCVADVAAKTVIGSVREGGDVVVMTGGIAIVGGLAGVVVVLSCPVAGAHRGGTGFASAR